MKTKEKPNGVKAEIWSLVICESSIDALHGGGRRISELYIPSSGIVINSIDGAIRCFREDGERYKKPKKNVINHSNPVKKGITYVPTDIYLGAIAMVEASDVLKSKIGEVFDLCYGKGKNE